MSGTPDPKSRTLARGPHIAFATNEWAYRYMTFTAWLLLRKRTG